MKNKKKIFIIVLTVVVAIIFSTYYHKTNNGVSQCSKEYCLSIAVNDRKYGFPFTYYTSFGVTEDGDISVKYQILLADIAINSLSILGLELLGFKAWKMIKNKQSI